MALQSVDDVLTFLLADAQPIASRQVSLDAARLGVLAADIVAPVDVPPADNSAMDGYAMRVADAVRPLPVSQRIAAGAQPVPLQPGTAARIFTGAEIPAGADCVVAQEDCLDVDAVVSLRPEEKPRIGQHIRPRGQDIARGQRILEAGVRLAPPQLGLLASLGIGMVPVRAGLRVALMSTGDELREPGQVLAGGQIYNSNRPMLAAMLSALGCEVIDIGIVADTPEDTREALDRARIAADLVISTGGVSVGEEDHVKRQIEAMGTLSLWKLAIKPGKPLAYGRLPKAGADDVPFFGLPGNPVSSFVTFALLVRPYILRMLGVADPLPVMRSGRADFDWPRPGGRQEYLRARITERANESWLELHPQQSSGALSSVAWCNALVVVPVGKTLQRGDALQYLPLDSLLS